MKLDYTSRNNTPKCNYYVAVFAYNDVLYADSDWYTWPILWRKTEVSPLDSYESAVGVVEDVVDYITQHNLSWRIEIQRGPK